MRSLKERRRKFAKAVIVHVGVCTLLFVALRLIFSSTLASANAEIPYHIMALSVVMGVLAFFFGAGHARLFGTHQVIPANRLKRAVKSVVYAGPLFVAPTLPPLSLVTAIILYTFFGVSMA